MSALRSRRSFLGAAAAASAVLGLALGSLASHAAEPLRVGTDATFPPMEFVDNGKRTGFDVELVEAIGAKLGRKIEWVDIDFKGLIPGLIAKRFDLAVSAIYITDERRKVVDFTDPYFAGGLVVMVKDNNQTIKTPADLAGKKVSVQVGTKSVGYLQEHYPKAQRVEVEKNQEMFNLVDIGRADAAVTGKPAAFHYVRTRGGLKVLDQQLTTEEYGMALRKDSADLTRAVNAAIAQLKADGTYAALVKKWFSNAPAK
ncbi:MAG: glutamine ABC transporter substrate-binding protein [Burkholderiales bacterium]|nr:glutamine ABC transporter substrate-binding protein [Pseudomonadota bacterium]MCC7066894.1 glutamine ABC transporter substrate-binding protein [Burkholderiales bacterium]